MVQNVSIPREEGRGDDCWNRDPKSFIDTPDLASRSSTSNLSRYQVYNQSDPRLQQIRVNSPQHPQISVQNALMNCGLDITDYVLVYAGTQSSENPIVVSSPGLKGYARRILNDRVCSMFTRCVDRSRNESRSRHPGGSRNLGQFDVEGSHDPWDGRLFSHSGFPLPRLRDAKSEDSDDARPHKRARTHSHRFRQSSAEMSSIPIPVTKTQPLIIGNDADVEKFYFIRFKDMQQSSCKVMGKAFVKLVEPKKQTHHPYTGGNEKAPSWWPPTKGENAVRHKEPDHLLKPERINLLVHILKMIIEPSERQNPTVQKLGLNVKKLEETTMEVMSNWFNDKEHPENLQKKKYLKEIFRVARMQERYKRGEIDATTTIPVICGAENRTQEGSDDDGDELTFTDPEPEIEQHTEALPNVTGVPTPESIVSPSLLQHPQHLSQLQSQSESDLCLPSSHSFRHKTPQRTPLSSATNYDSQLYRLDVNSFQPPPQSISSLQDPSRRQFTGFHNPQSTISSQWPTPMINTSGSNSMYFTQPSNSLTYLPPPPPPPPSSQQSQQAQHPMHTAAHHGYDSLSTGSLGTNRVFEGGSPLGSQQPLNTSGMTYTSQTNFNYSPESGSYRTQEHEVKQEQNQLRPS